MKHIYGFLLLLVLGGCSSTSSDSLTQKQPLILHGGNLRYEFTETGTYKIAIVEPIKTPMNPMVTRITICVEDGNCSSPSPRIRCKENLVNGSTGSWESDANAGCTITVWKGSGKEILRVSHPDGWTGNTAEWEGDGYKIKLNITKVN